MAVGTVKWFNNRKGYGFIQPQDGGRDVFVHISALEKAGLQSLEENAKIEYQLMESRGKTVATELKLDETASNDSDEFETAYKEEAYAS